MIKQDKAKKDPSTKKKATRKKNDFFLFRVALPMNGTGNGAQMTEPRSYRVNFHLLPTTERTRSNLLEIRLLLAVTSTIAFLAFAGIRFLVVAFRFEHDVRTDQPQGDRLFVINGLINENRKY